MEPQIVEHIHKEACRLTDSLSIGSSAKNCEMKVYFDASNPEEARKRIDEAVKLRNYLISQVKVD